MNSKASYGVPMSEEQVKLQEDYLCAFAAANPGAAMPTVCVSVRGWWYVNGDPCRKTKLIEMRDALLRRVSN